MATPTARMGNDADEAARWSTLERAAAAADAATPRGRDADPEIVTLQRLALTLLDGWLPGLAERERFERAIEYFS